jgi:Ca2+-binding RTX toxin-like protein
MSEAISAFNEATTADEILAAIKTHGADLLSLESQGEYATIPGPSGRQTAIATGLLEIKKFFGDFTEETLPTALAHQVSVEYNKYVFIQAIDNASDVAAIVAVLKTEVTSVATLNDQRQDLITEWSKYPNNKELAARVEQLKADTYTKALAAVDARLGNAEFVEDLAEALLAARDAAGGRLNSVVTITNIMDATVDAIDPVYAFNSATTADEMLAAIKAHYETLLDDTTDFEGIPDLSGRQKAVADGVLEIKKFFGEFASVDEAAEALALQASVEYNKYVFIQAIDNAVDLDAMVKALKDYAGVLSEQRQDLIEAWGAVTGNSALAERVDQLEAEPYTIVLKEVADRLVNPNFIQDLATKLLVARDDAGGRFNGVVTIVDAIEGNMDITAPAAPTVALTDDTGADDGITNNGALTVTAESGATVEYQVDGGTWSTTYDPSTLAAGQHTVKARAKDAAGNLSSEAGITFTLDTAAPNVASPLTLAENADGTSAPVEIAALNPEEGETFTINEGADSTLFDIVEGKLVYVGGALDFESVDGKKSFALTITAEDAAGNIEEHEVTVNLTNVNEAPVAAATGNNASGNEDTVITGGVPSGSDVDAGNSVKYELVTAVAGLTLNADGTFRYAPPADFNGVVEFQYRVVDAAGAKSEAQTFKLTVNAVNDAPRDVLLSNSAVMENAANGTEVGKLSASDPEGGSFSYALMDSADGRFTIDSSGTLRVANGLKLDYEQAKSHQVVVRVTDTSGASYNETLTISVNDNPKETVSGSTGSDKISGGSGNDRLAGGSGNDALNAGAGKDNLNGGTGNDRLTGGAGQDTLTGGSGKDVFVFANKDTGSTKGTADYITDFSGRGGDKIDLKLIDADTKKKGDQAFSFIGKEAFTKAGQVRFEKTSKETYVYLNTDSDKSAEAVIKLKGAFDLQKGWFVL